MDSPPIPNDLLVDIFLRLTNPTDLVRASAACTSFHRLVADHSFLRRYRKLHAPPLLGFIDYRRKVFHPADPPHPSAPAASAVALAADFSFFLPAPADDWVVQDVRDGRVLLDRPRSQHHADWARRKLAFWETAVCDPLHRRYFVLPSFPEDLSATVAEDAVRKSGAFLIPSDNDEPTSFRVVLMVQGDAKLFAFVFSSSTGQWRAVSSQNWVALLAGFVSAADYALFYFRTYAYGCFYWLTSSIFWRGEMKMLVFDTRRMEFSIVELPTEARSFCGFDTDIAMVEAGEGRPGMFVLESSPADISLHYTIMQNNCGSSCSQWQKVKTIPLSPGTSYALAGSVERYLLLVMWGRSSPKLSCFTMDIKTFQLERIIWGGHKSGHVYSNFPPSLLSSPTVSSGSQEDAEKATLKQIVEALQAEEPVDVDAGGRAGVSRIGEDTG